MSAERLVTATDLHRFYGEHHALHGLTFELHRGEVLGLLGPNGAGKTTTMQILTGALAPSVGSVEICGVDLLERPREAKRHVGYLPESPPLYVELTVDEYLRFCARMHGVARRDLARAVVEAKDRCGLGDVGGRLLGNLSKGFRQRVGVAQAIAHDPQVVILDEPTVGLDPNQIREIRALVRELGTDHGVLISTHILPEVQAVCDRVQIIDGGRLLLDERMEALTGASSLRVGLRHPPAAEALGAIPGVERVETTGTGRYRLHGRPDAIAPEAVARAAADAGWELFELVEEQPTLEEIFVALTCGETDSAPGRTGAAEPVAA